MGIPNPRVELIADVNQFLGGMAKARGSMKDVEVQAAGGLGSAMKAAETSFSRMASQSGGLAGSFAKVGEATGVMGAGTLVGVGAVAIAGGTIAKFGASSVKAYQDLAGEVRRFQVVTGASAQDSSKLVSAFRALGVDSDRVGTAMFRLSKNLDGSSNALAAYGVQVAHTKNGNVDMVNTFLNIADAVQKAGKGQEANAITAAAFGARIGKDLLPALLRGREGMQQFFDAAKDRGEIFNDKDLQASKEFSLTMRALSADAKALEVQIGRQLVPVLGDMAGGLERLLRDADSLTSHIGGLGTVMRVGMAVGTMGASEGLRQLGHDHHSAAAAAEEQTASLKELEAELTAEQKKIDLLGKTVEAAQSAHMSYTAAQKTVTDSSAALVTAQDKLSDLLKKGAVDVKAVASATKEHDSSLVGVREANERAADAQARVDELMRKGAVDTKAVAAAQRDLERASDGVTSAQERLTTAEKELAEVRRGASTLDKVQASLRSDEADMRVQEAEQALQDMYAEGVSTAADYHKAQNAVTQAKIDQQRASDDLLKVTQQGTAGTPDVVAAEKAVKDATKAVTDAQESQADAAEKLRVAQAGDPQFDQNLAVAKREAADATSGVATAIDAEKDAADKLRVAQLGDPEFADKLRVAKDAVKSATEKLTGANEAAQKAAFDSAKAFDAEKKALEDAGGEVANYRDQLDQLARDHPEASPFVAKLEADLPTNPQLPPVSDRAGWGGPVLGHAAPQGDIVLHVDGREIARITQTNLLKQGRNNLTVLGGAN